jgi:hypothetical protein
MTENTLLLTIALLETSLFGIRTTDPDVNQALDDGENKRGIPDAASNGPSSLHRKGNTMSEPTVV